MNDKTVNRIFDIMKTRNLSAAEVSRNTYIKPQVITQWKQGKQKPSADALSKLADYFDVSVDYLLGRTDTAKQPEPHLANEYVPDGFITMPVIGSITAGYDGLAEEEFLGYYGVIDKALKGYPKEDCFILRVDGNSMYPDFRNGDLVAVHKQNSVDPGDIAVVLYNGDCATLKQVDYEHDCDWVKLIPRNPEYETKTISGEDLEECRILGKVISLVSREVG